MLRAALVLLALTSPALPGEKLGLTGTFGDEYGCEGAAGDWEADRGVYIAPDRYGGYEWSCSFAWVGKGEQQARIWSVIALCSAEGTPYTKVLAVQEKGDSVYVHEGDMKNGEGITLERC